MSRQDIKFKDVLMWLFALGGWLIILITVLWAFFNGGWYAFHINLFGEMYLDFAITIAIVVFIIYYIIKAIREI